MITRNSGYRSTIGGANIAAIQTVGTAKQASFHRRLGVDDVDQLGELRRGQRLLDEVVFERELGLRGNVADRRGCDLGQRREFRAAARVLEVDAPLVGEPLE